MGQSGWQTCWGGTQQQDRDEALGVSEGASSGGMFSSGFSSAYYSNDTVNAKRPSFGEGFFGSQPDTAGPGPTRVGVQCC